MSIYGFDKEPEPVILPSRNKRKSAKDLSGRAPDLVDVEAAVSAGEVHGFLDRSPDKSKKLRLKPGRKRTEEQDRITIPGPKRVIDRLRKGAKEHDVAVWRALEMALDGEL